MSLYSPIRINFLRSSTSASAQLHGAYLESSRPWRSLPQKHSADNIVLRAFLELLGHPVRLLDSNIPFRNLQSMFDVILNIRHCRSRRARSKSRHSITWVVRRRFAGRIRQLVLAISESVKCFFTPSGQINKNSHNSTHLYAPSAQLQLGMDSEEQNIMST